MIRLLVLTRLVSAIVDIKAVIAWLKGQAESHRLTPAGDEPPPYGEEA